MNMSSGSNPHPLVTKQELRTIAEEAGIGPNAGSSVFYVARRLAKDTPEAHGIKHSEPAIALEVLADMAATPEYLLRKIGKGARAVIGLAYERFHDESSSLDAQPTAAGPADNVPHGQHGH